MKDINVWLTIVSLAIGFIAGIYLPRRFRKDEKRPMVSIGPFQHRYNIFEITNHGGDLLQLAVEIAWLQGGRRESRVLNNFLNANDDPVRVRPHMPGSLKRGETKKACDCPLYSDDGNVEVRVSGQSTDNERYSTTFTLKNTQR